MLEKELLHSHSKRAYKYKLGVDPVRLLAVWSTHTILFFLQKYLKYLFSLELEFYYDNFDKIMHPHMSHIK